MTTRDFAIAYAAHGWPVFPLWPVKGRDCACADLGCAAAGKHPITRGWPNAIASVAAAESSWREQFGDRGIGIALGPRSGMWVLDVDPRHGGDEQFARLERDYEPLPPRSACRPVAEVCTLTSRGRMTASRCPTPTGSPGDWTRAARAVSPCSHQAGTSLASGTDGSSPRAPASSRRHLGGCLSSSASGSSPCRTPTTADRHLCPLAADTRRSSASVGTSAAWGSPRPPCSSADTRSCATRSRSTTPSSRSTGSTPTGRSGRSPADTRRR